VNIVGTTLNSDLKTLISDRSVPQNVAVYNAQGCGRDELQVYRNAVLLVSLECLKERTSKWTVNSLAGVALLQACFAGLFE
jgi:hypothetical protein